MESCAIQWQSSLHSIPKVLGFIPALKLKGENAYCLPQGTMAVLMRHGLNKIFTLQHETTRENLI